MPQQLDKRLVALHFGRRAASYEAATPVQAGMARDLLAHVRAKLHLRPVDTILELGCGSGRLTRMLRETWPGARLVSVDISADMLALARQKCPGGDFVLADAEDFLQGCDQRFDLVISNATLQWFQTPALSLLRCRALLKPGGVVALTTFGCDTFRELRASFAEAYARSNRPVRQHSGDFPEISFWQKLLPRDEIEEWHVTLHFESVRAFLRSVQLAGATNAFAHPGYVPRDVLRQMQDVYATRFPSPDGYGIRATYHIVRIVITEGSDDQRA
jgi:malonyl-CoA O-methyltransferase